MFATRTTDYTELHYLLSWTNTASSGWNGGMENVLHFTYQNYVELLPKELEQVARGNLAQWLRLRTKKQLSG